MSSTHHFVDANEMVFRGVASLIRPSSSCCDFGDSGFFHSKYLSDFRLSASRSQYDSNFANFFQRQLCVAVIFPGRLVAMLFLVQCIVSTSVPSKIARAVVARISVIVTRLHSGWTLADKSSQYSTVNKYTLWLFGESIGGGKNAVTVTIRCRENFSAAKHSRHSNSICRNSVKTANPSVIRDFVELFVSRNFTPDFKFGSVLLRHADLLKRYGCLEPHDASTSLRLAYYPANRGGNQ